MGLVVEFWDEVTVFYGEGYGPGPIAGILHDSVEVFVAFSEVGVVM